MAETVTNLLAMQETRVPSLERERQSTPVFLPGESRGQRSLAGYSLQDRRVDTTDRLNSLTKWVLDI